MSLSLWEKAGARNVKTADCGIYKNVGSDIISFRGLVKGGKNGSLRRVLTIGVILEGICKGCVAVYGVKGFSWCFRLYETKSRLAEHTRRLLKGVP